MMRKLLIFMMILISVAPLAKVWAFPGDEEDERCAQLVQQAVDQLAGGQQVEQPDCLLNAGLSATEMRAAEAEMRLYPVPNVVQVPPDDSIIYWRKYVRLRGDVPVYDAPGGNVIRVIPDGLNLVSYIGKIEGWYQLRQNEWVETGNNTDAIISSFSGVEIHAPLERPFAWMLVPVSPSRYPGGPPDESLPEIPRYQLLNIYGVEIVDGWEWYLVGDNQWIQQIRVAKVKPVARPAEILPTDRWVAVDLFEQTAVAYQGDEMQFATLISSGLPQWSTEEGLFRIYQRWKYGPMSGAAGYLGDAYSIENIPHIMYFNGDMALHAAYWHDKFGYRQSRGCVNLSLMDAAWIYEWTSAPEYQNAWVYVYSSDRYRADLPAWAIRPR